MKDASGGTTHDSSNVSHNSLVSHNRSVRTGRICSVVLWRERETFVMQQSIKSTKMNKISTSRTKSSTDSKAIEVCQGCRKPIKDRYLLNSLGRNWHEDCLKCNCCEARLGEVGESLFTRANLILCKRDYLRIFGTPGYCSACSKSIPAFEYVMRAKSNVYHLDCFACQLCGHRFCVGDRFYLSENKILCESDYNERVMYGSNSFDNSRMNVYSSPMMDVTNQYRSMQMTETNDCNNNSNSSS